MLFEESQTNRLWLGIAVVVFIPAIILVLVLLTRDDVESAIALALIGPTIGLIALIGGSQLNTTVDPAQITLRWRFGWPNKTIERSDVSSVEALQIPIWYGWGIRKVPNGWMWNVKGRSAVALHLTNGKRFLIGTGEPDTLTATLQL